MLALATRPLQLLPALERGIETNALVVPTRLWPLSSIPLSASLSLSLHPSGSLSLSLKGKREREGDRKRRGEGSSGAPRLGENKRGIAKYRGRSDCGREAPYGASLSPCRRAGHGGALTLAM